MDAIFGKDECDVFEQTDVLLLSVCSGGCRKLERDYAEFRTDWFLCAPFYRPLSIILLSPPLLPTIVGRLILQQMVTLDGTVSVSPFASISVSCWAIVG